MKRALLLAAFGLLAGVAYRFAPVREGSAAPACSCPTARAENGWCEACGVGYAAELEMRTKVVHDALDLHGHDVDPRSFSCASCQEALRTDGFCAACRRGFIAQRAYLSALAYHLAHGERAAAEEDLRLVARALEVVPRCEFCAAAMVLDGTCPKCRVSYRAGNPVPR